MIQALAYVALRVPQPEEAAAFYEQVLGLERVSPTALASRPRGAVRLAPPELVLLPGPPGLDHIAFEVDGWDGLPEGDHQGGQRVVAGPDGWRLVFQLPQPGRPRRLPEAPFHVARLGHVTLMSPQPAEAARWCQQRLGLRLSEQLGEEFFWLRCNRDHHALAFQQGPRPGLHHIGFEVQGWDDLRLLCDHLYRHGYTVEYGPGRHSAGDNLFVYFVDPWGVRFEFFCDLRRIDDEAGYVPPVRSVPVTRSVNRWGPAPPPSFLEHALWQGGAP